MDKNLGRTYRLVDAPPIQGLHGPLSGARVIVLDESIVVAPLLYSTVRITITSGKRLVFGS